MIRNLTMATLALLAGTPTATSQSEGTGKVILSIAGAASTGKTVEFTHADLEKTGMTPATNCRISSR
jgi:hypothetical protein